MTSVHLRTSRPRLPSIDVHVVQKDWRVVASTIVIFPNDLEIEAQLYNRDYTKDSHYCYTKVCIVSIVIPHYTKGIGNKSIMIQTVGMTRECIICKIYEKTNINSIVSVDGS
jgi:hypothetical protein